MNRRDRPQRLAIAAAIALYGYAPAFGQDETFIPGLPEHMNEQNVTATERGTKAFMDGYAQGGGGLMGVPMGAITSGIQWSAEMQKMREENATAIRSGKFNGFGYNYTDLASITDRMDNNPEFNTNLEAYVRESLRNSMPKGFTEADMVAKMAEIRRVVDEKLATGNDFLVVNNNPDSKNAGTIAAQQGALGSVPSADDMAILQVLQNLVNAEKSGDLQEQMNALASQASAFNAANQIDNVPTVPMPEGFVGPPCPVSLCDPPAEDPPPPTAGAAAVTVAKTGGSGEEVRKAAEKALNEKYKGRTTLAGNTDDQYQYQGQNNGLPVGTGGTQPNGGMLVAGVPVDMSKHRDAELDNTVEFLLSNTNGTPLPQKDPRYKHVAQTKLENFGAWASALLWRDSTELLMVGNGTPCNLGPDCDRMSAQGQNLADGNKIYQQGQVRETDYALLDSKKQLKFVPDASPAACQTGPTLQCT